MELLNSDSALIYFKNQSFDYVITIPYIWWENIKRENKTFMSMYDIT